MLSQLHSHSHLSLSIIQAALFNQNTVCFLSYTSCHCLKQWDSSLSSNTCCDVSILLLCSLNETQENCGILHMRNTHTYVYRRGRYLFRPWHHSWVTEIQDAAVEALDVSFPPECLPFLCPSAELLSEIQSEAISIGCFYIHCITFFFF